MKALKYLLVLLLALIWCAPPANAGWFKHSKKPNYRYKVPKLKYKKPKIKGHQMHKRI